MIAGVKGQDFESTAKKIYENTLNFFDLNSRGEQLESIEDDKLIQQQDQQSKQSISSKQ